MNNTNIINRLASTKIVKNNEFTKRDYLYSKISNNNKCRNTHIYMSNIIVNFKMI
jgi:hypothetical protein